MVLGLLTIIIVSFCAGALVMLVVCLFALRHFDRLEDEDRRKINKIYLKGA